MLCVVIDAGTGALVALDPQPIAPDATTCPLVVQAYTELSSVVWQLTTEQGGQIATAVLLVWAVAFVFRLLIKTLSIEENHEASS